MPIPLSRNADSRFWRMLRMVARTGRSHGGDRVLLDGVGHPMTGRGAPVEAHEDEGLAVDHQAPGVRLKPGGVDTGPGQQARLPTRPPAHRRADARPAR